MDNQTFKHARFANEVTSTTARGTSFTGYANNKIVWAGDLSDGAKNDMYFLDAVNVKQLAKGEKSILVPYRKYYPTGASVTFDTDEKATDGNITTYATNLIDGVVITPTPYSAGAAVTGYAEQGNIRDLIMDKMDSLSYSLADKVDVAIAAALAAATKTTSTVAGTTTLYGGVAYTDAGIAAGNILTTELINKAETILAGKTAFYWNGAAFTKCSGIKNPWKNEATSPFVLMIGQAQKKALRDSSQFVNAAEYGSQVVISSGEIGSYLGIRVICSNNAPEAATGAAAFDGGSVTTTNITRCMLMKGRAAYTHVWGRSPTFMPWAKAWADIKGFSLVCDYAGSVVHADAIVNIDVADN
jgi:N4-gp56 family major capsid protein